MGKYDIMKFYTKKTFLFLFWRERGGDVFYLASEYDRRLKFFEDTFDHVPKNFYTLSCSVYKSVYIFLIFWEFICANRLTIHSRYKPRTISKRFSLIMSILPHLVCQFFCVALWHQVSPEDLCFSLLLW